MPKNSAVLCCALVFSACGGPSFDDRAAIDVSAMDETADPCQDFFRYACGSYMDHADQGNPRAFQTVLAQTEADLQSLEGAWAKSTADVGTQLAAQFLTLCENDDDERAIAWLRAELAKIDQATDRTSKSAVLGRLQALGVSLPFGVSAGQSSDSRKIGAGLAAHKLRGGSDDASTTARLRSALVWAGRPDPDGAVAAALDLIHRQEAGEFSGSEVDAQTSTTVDETGLAALLPSLDLDAYWAGFGVTPPPTIEVAGRDTVALHDAMLAEPALWDLLRSGLIDAVAPNLRSPIADRDCFLADCKREEKDCRDRARTMLPDVYSTAFLDLALPPAHRAEAEAMVMQIADELRMRLQANTWLDEATRAEALAKLAAMDRIVGAQARAIDTTYPGVPTDSYVAMRFGLAAYERVFEMNQVGLPVGQVFPYPADIVNAYYDLASNSAIILAGILRAPFWNGTAANSYATIGMIIGHELTHGFDSEGSKRDGEGVLRNWWTPAAAQGFDARKACVVQQYIDAYPDDDMTLGPTQANGKLAENIADLGGVTIASEAAKKDPAFATVAPTLKLDPTQQFFVSYAQVWCSSVTDKSDPFDPHASPRYRVNAPLSNLPAFADAFHCGAGAKMVRADRCEIW